MDADQLAERLAECGCMLCELPPDDLAALAGMIGPRHFPAGATLFRQDDPAAGFHVVETGSVRVARLSPDGREQILHIFGPGELIGEVPVFQGGRYPAGAVAVSAVASLWIPRDRFVQLSEGNPALLLDMLALLARRLRNFVGMIDALALKDVRTRLAHHLMSAARNGAVELDVTKAVLANLLGTKAETLSRTLKRLEQSGCIAVHGARIEILDATLLDAIATGLD
ncbi:MAG: Crp/Fnr family transcriptional regulator [Planctomycetota bacterium]